MNLLRLISITLFLIAGSMASAQKFASANGDLLTLDNGVVRRAIQIGADGHGVVSQSYTLKKTMMSFYPKARRIFILRPMASH